MVRKYFIYNNLFNSSRLILKELNNQKQPKKMSSGAVKSTTKKTATKAESTKAKKPTTKKTVEVATNEAVKSKPREKREKVKYACYVLPNVTIDIQSLSDESASSEARETIRNKIIAAMGDVNGLISGGNCSGTNPSLAANKKAKAAAAHNSNIIILRPLGQFKIFFTYAAQRVRVRELEYTTDDQGRKVSAVDKKTGQSVPGISRRIKTDDSASLVTSTYWSEFENKVVSLKRIKFEKKPAAFLHHKKTDDEAQADGADDAQE